MDESEIQNSLQSYEEQPEDRPNENEFGEKLMPTKLLGFRNYQMDQIIKFKRNVVDSNKHLLYIFFSILSCSNLLSIILKIIFSEDISHETRRASINASIVLDFISLLLSLVLFFLIKRLHTRRGLLLFTTIFVFLPILLACDLILSDGYFIMYYSTISTLRFVVSYLVCTQSSVMSFSQTIIYQVYTSIVFTVFHLIQYNKYIQNRNTTSISIVNYLISYYTTTCMSLIMSYIRTSSEIQSFNNKNLDADSAIKIKEFVGRLLPKHISSEIANEGVVEEKVKNVTLLFADISGFTSYSSDKSPRVVVDMLRRLFTDFDKECSKLDLFKLYTIGDCYVVMSFVDKNNRKDPALEAANVLRLCFKMIEIIAQVREQIKFSGLHMRIGVHTGDIIGGVIGTGIVRYDLYGQDVLIANKMESSGEEDKVQISEATKELLTSSKYAKYFKFLQGKKVEIKSLMRTVKTYFVEKQLVDVIPKRNVNAAPKKSLFRPTSVKKF